MNRFLRLFNNNCKTVITFALLFVSAISLQAQSASSDSTWKSYPYIMFIDDTVSVPQISDDEFYKKSAKVTFIVNKSNLNLESPFMKELNNKVIPALNADSLQLKFMMIRGAASPEGPYLHNVELAKGRGKNLFDFVNKKLLFPVSEENSKLFSIPEDYINLCRLMHEAYDPLTPVVESLVNKYMSVNNLAGLKKALMRHNGGKTWSHMFKRYFPQLRAANVIFFVLKPEAKPEKVEKVEEPEATVECFDSVAKPEVLLSWEERIIRRHVLAVRTNLLYDFFYMPGHYWAPSPNLQLEYYPKSGHITANLGFTFPYWHWWNKYQFWQIRDYVLEGRYYFRGNGVFLGPYVSAYAHINKYGIGFSKTKGWEGEGYGAGVLGGWVFNISKNKRWRLECSLGLGYYRTNYDPYVYGNPKSLTEDGKYYYDYTGKASDFKKRNHVFNWFGPTNIGIHLTYDLLYRRVQKRGVSFNRSETIQHIQEGGQK